MTNHIILQPLTIHWSEWRKHKRPVITKHDMETIMREVSAWQKRVDDWLNSLSEQQKHDLMMLALAEIDMLWAAVDIHSKPGDTYYEDERLDFRTRFYDLQPLVATYKRLGIKDAERLYDALRSLEDYVVITLVEWLP